MYLTRKGHSRSVSNDDAMIDALQKAADIKGLKLVVYQHKEFPTLDDVIDLFHNHARAVVGPHGGAFYNQLFCSEDTLLVEMFPIRRSDHWAIRWPEAVWWPAAFFSHRYYMIPVESVAGVIEAPVDQVMGVLHSNL